MPMVSIVRPVSPRTDLQAGWGAQKKPPVLQGGASECDYLPDSQVGDTGLEPTANSSEKTALSEADGAESGALGARNGPIDPQLASVIDAWPGLSEPIKAGILAMIRAARVGTTEPA